MTQIPSSALHSPAHTQAGKDCWGIFLLNNSRHSVGLNLSLQLLSSDPLTLFSWILKQGASPCSQQTLTAFAISWPTPGTTGSKSNEVPLQICGPVLSPCLDSFMSYIAQVVGSPFTKAVLLRPWDFSTARHGQNNFKNYPGGLRQCDQHMLRLWLH